MEHINLKQGSQEWLEHRAKHFNASDAPAMLGISPYKTRNELLHEMATGITPEIDDATQARFDDGHRFEALARPLAQKIIGKNLYPVVAKEGIYSASFDGITMDEEDTFEHKSLNNTIRGCSYAEDLPEYLRVQMEHQFIVGGKRCLFLATKWDENDELLEEISFLYQPDPELRNRIIEGWSQFQLDLINYQYVEEAPVVIGKAPETLPALRVEVTGMVTSSNLLEFKETALAVFESINKDLQTDEDFSNAAKTVKWCGEVESRLEAAKDHALSQTSTIDELFKTIDDIKEQARATRLDLDKMVKARKEAVRVEIVQAGKSAISTHIENLNERLGKSYMPVITADFGGAIKGKRTISSQRNAVDTELANAKIRANEIADKIQKNLNSLRDLAADHAFLFSDTSMLVLKDNDDLVNIIKLRITEHQQAEEKRIEAQREKIRLEEQQKLEEKNQEKAEPQEVEALPQAKEIKRSTPIRRQGISEVEQVKKWASTSLQQAIIDAPLVNDPELKELLNSFTVELSHMKKLSDELKDSSANKAA